MSATALIALPCDLWIDISRTWLANALTIRGLDIACCNRSLRPLFLSWIRDIELESYPDDVLSSRAVTDLRPRRTMFIQWLVRRKIHISSISISCGDASTLEFLDIVVSANPQLLSKVKTVMVNEFAYSSPSNKSLLRSILSPMSDVTSMICDEMEAEIGPWAYLPHPDRVQTLDMAVYCSPLIGPDLRLHDQLPNLERLTMTGDKEQSEPQDILDLQRALALFKSLRLLALHDLDCGLDAAPAESAWATYPQLLFLETLVLQNVLPNQSTSFSSFLLDRCPRVSAFTLTTSSDDDASDVLALLDRKVPDLHYLDWTDRRSCLRLVAEEATGRSFRESVKDRDRAEGADSVSLSNPDDGLVAHFALILRNASLKKFAIHVGDTEAPKVLSADVFDLFGQLHNLTQLHFSSTTLPCEPHVWAGVVSRPVLEELSFRSCVNVHSSLTVGLADCVAKGVKSTSLRSFSVTSDKTDQYSALCLLLSKVFPCLSRLSLLIPSVPVTLMLDVLFHIHSLRRMVVRSKMYPGPEGDFLKSMTSEMWQAVAKTSRCHCWEILVSDFDWPNLRRMIDSLGRHLYDLHVVVDEGSTVELEESMEEYLRLRRFRLTCEYA